MKRNATAQLQEEETRLSRLLFKKTKNLADTFSKGNDTVKEEFDQKPAWNDKDDRELLFKVQENVKLHSEKLKQKFEALIGTPKWAKLNRRHEEKENENSNKILRTVGHLQKTKSTTLKKDFLEIKKFPKINAETGNEGPVIKCIEFHPSLSVSLVAGYSGVVSLFSIGGDTYNKLHSFQLQNWKINMAHFCPDGTQAFISSKSNHNYCIYDLAKAQPMLVQLPQVVKKPAIFELSPNGKYIATAIGFDEVYLICAKSKELIRSLKHNTNVVAIAFSPDCEQLFSYGNEGIVTIWNLSTYRVQNKFYDNGCVKPSIVTVSPCGKLLATGSGEGIVNVYEKSEIKDMYPVPMKTISNLKTKITSVKFNATTEIMGIASGFMPNAVKLVHIPSYHVFQNFPQQTDLHQVDFVNFSPNSGFMAHGNNKNSAYLYRLKHYKNY